MSADGLAQIYELQEKLQVRLGTSPATMSQGDLQSYIRLNVTALIAEAIEALDETNWKPWTTAEPGIRDRERFLTELSDCLHFLMNLYLAAGATAEEILASYVGKNQKNHARQDDGYTGLDKCATCRRELDGFNAQERFIAGYGTFMFCDAACSGAFRMDG